MISAQKDNASFYKTGRCRNEQWQKCNNLDSDSRTRGLLMKKKRLVIRVIIGLLLLIGLLAAAYIYRVYITDKIILHSSQIDKSYISYKGNIIELDSEDEKTLLKELLKLCNNYDTKFEPILTCVDIKDYKVTNQCNCYLFFFFNPAQLSKTHTIQSRAGHIYCIGYSPNDNSDCHTLFAGFKENGLFSANGTGMCNAYGNWPNDRDKSDFNNFDKRIQKIVEEAGYEYTTQ